MAELLAAGLTGGVVSRDVMSLKAPDGPPHDLGQYYLLMDPGVSGEFFERLQKVEGAIALDKGAQIVCTSELDVALLRMQLGKAYKGTSIYYLDIYDYGKKTFWKS